jgi:hypothetical protein
MDDPISTIYATKDTLRTLSVHEHAPVFSMWVLPSSFFSFELTQISGAQTATKSRPSTWMALTYPHLSHTRASSITTALRPSPALLSILIALCLHVPRWMITTSTSCPANQAGPEASWYVYTGTCFSETPFFNFFLL